MTSALKEHIDWALYVPNKETRVLKVPVASIADYTDSSRVLVVMKGEDEKALKLMQFLINVGVKLNNDLGSTALRVAVRHDNFKTARLLVEHGADMFQRNGNGICARDMVQSMIDNLETRLEELYGLLNANGKAVETP